MAKEPDSLVLELLRRIDRRLDRMERNLNVLSVRAGHMEVMLEDMQWNLGLCDEHVRSMECSVGRIENRFGRMDA